MTGCGNIPRGMATLRNTAIRLMHGRVPAPCGPLQHRAGINLEDAGHGADAQSSRKGTHRPYEHLGQYAFARKRRAMRFLKIPVARSHTPADATLCHWDGHWTGCYPVLASHNRCTHGRDRTEIACRPYVGAPTREGVGVDNRAAGECARGPARRRHIGLMDETCKRCGCSGALAWCLRRQRRCGARGGAVGEPHHVEHET